MKIFDPELEEKIVEVARSYSGDITHLEAAIGAMAIGQMFGWKVLRVAHGGTAYANYEKILGIKFKDWCRRDTDWTNRSPSIVFADKVKDFWGVVQGNYAGERSRKVNAE